MYNVLVLLFHVVVSAVTVIISKLYYIYCASACSTDLEILVHC